MPSVPVEVRAGPLGDDLFLSRHSAVLPNQRLKQIPSPRIDQGSDACRRVPRQCSLQPLECGSPPSLPEEQLEHIQPDDSSDQRKAGDEAEMQVDPGRHQYRQPEQRRAAGFVVLPKQRKERREEQHREHLAARDGAVGDQRYAEYGHRGGKGRTTPQQDGDRAHARERAYPRKQSEAAQQINAIEQQLAGDGINPRRAGRGVGEDVGRWNVMVLDDPAAAGHLPAEVRIGNRAQSGQQRVDERNAAEDEKQNAPQRQTPRAVFLIAERLRRAASAPPRPRRGLDPFRCKILFPRMVEVERCGL